MKQQAIATCILLAACMAPAICQEHGSVPIYRVTVVQRSLDAINYQYRSGPTQIDFVGTVLLPKSKGEAVVDSVRGRTEIDAKIEHLEAPSRFGREYLSYVLWAITPEGRPHNIGELVADAGDKSKVRVTTDLQAFGLMVTAEPYAAVRQPSDVVVLENRVRPDTIGKIEKVEIKYELMPRGHYTLQQPANPESSPNTPKVSMDRYEAILQLYQAQNAIGIARAARADQYAPNTFAKAEQLLAEAQRLDQVKGNSRMVVQNAREASQTAEDARAIAERRMQDEKVARAQADVSEARAQADAEVARARNEADAARAQADAERSARERAEADAAAARDRAAQAVAAAAPLSRVQAPIQTTRVSQDRTELAKNGMRMRLLEQLNGAESTRDTPRGLVVTVPDASFSGGELRGPSLDRVARVGRILATQAGLRIQVEGYTDSGNSESVAGKRAAVVQGVLLGAGIPPNMVSARGRGDSRPITSNATPGGRIENRRVEIVVSGDPIGSLPFWDHAYSLTSR